MIVTDSGWQWATTVGGVFCLATTFAVAGPLVQERVARDSKWVLHLDGESFLKTQVGQYVADNMIEKEFGSFNLELKKNFGTEIAWRNAKSITAYGFEFKPNGQPNGVVIVEGEIGLTETLEKVWKKQQDQSIATTADLEVVDEGGNRTYIWKRDQYGTVVGKNLFALARTKEELARAKAVFTGKEPSLAKPATLKDASVQPVLEVLTPQGLDGAMLSGPAALLKRCNDGHLILGEKRDDVCLNVQLSASNTNVANQIRQVVQGIISLGVLGGDGDPNLQKLATSASVGGNENNISLKLQLPSKDVIKQLSEDTTEKKVKKQKKEKKEKKEQT